MRQQSRASHVVSARCHVSRVADLGKGLENIYWTWEICTYKDDVAVRHVAAELAGQYGGESKPIARAIGQLLVPWLSSRHSQKL